MIYVCPNCHQTSLLHTATCPWCAKKGQYIRMVESKESSMVMLGDVSVQDVPRLPIPGFHSVEETLSGGFVLGSTTLLYGPPGSGKSTLALELCAALSRYPAQPCPSFYITSEQMLAHVKMSAHRLRIQDAQVAVGYLKDADDLILLLDKEAKHCFVAIDSLHGLHLTREIRGKEHVAICEMICEVARKKTLAVLLISHATKEDDYAGPRTLEHHVDCVVSLAPSAPESQTLIWDVHNKYRFGSVPRSCFLTRDPEGRINARRYTSV